MKTDEAALQEFLTRGVERVYPSTEFLKGRLMQGKPLSLYLGIDPTGPTLHLGHLIPLLKLAQFQALGHKIILLIGDFTGMIGDPTDKLATRKRLSRAETLANATLYKKQASRILQFSGENAARLFYNSEWFDKLSYRDFHELASLVTTEHLLKRDMFDERQKKGKPIYLHEFAYPLLQGYDSVAMEVDGEVGGNDQTFNMLVGRDLLKKIKNKEKFVVATKLLTDSAGVKMGKTEGNMVAFSDTATDCFGKIMSWPDTMILAGFELCTRMPLGEVETIKSKMAEGGNPKDAKKRLAYEITALIKGAAEAEKARAEFTSAFSEGKPKEFLEITVSDSIPVADALIAKKVIESKTELRRLIKEGAITRVASGEKQGEGFLKSPPPGEYRIGKHRFVRIV